MTVVLFSLPGCYINTNDYLVLQIKEVKYVQLNLLQQLNVTHIFIYLYTSE